jgi:hypothetical protein
MFDYIGYEVGIKGKMTAGDLIEALASTRTVPYYFEALKLEGLPEDLRFIANHSIDWGMFASRWNRLQGLMRSVFRVSRTTDEISGSFSAIVSYMPRIHSNYYVHSQILIYYFFSEILPALEAINTNNILVDLVTQMCEKDAHGTLSRRQGGYFGQDVMGQDDLGSSVDDEADQTAEPED